MNIYNILILIIGLLIGLFGFKLKEKFISLIMCLLCVSLAYNISTTYFSFDSNTILVICILFGLIGLIFSRRIERFILVLVSSIGGYMLFMNMFSSMIPMLWLSISLGMLCGLLCALLVLKLERIAFILLTSFYGATLVYTPLSILITLPNISSNLLILIIGIIFSLIQFATTKN